MDLIESYLILRVRNKETRQKIKKLMSEPDFFRYGETNSIYYVKSTMENKYYQVSIDNNGSLKCNCAACEYGHKKCIHCFTTELLLYLGKN
jgi:hypothetical protein